MAVGLEKLNVRWFEEPVIPEDKEGYARLRRDTTVPIAGGECSFTKYGFRDLFTGPDGPCMDICQPDVAACGGISAFRDIATLASTFGVTIIPHVWGSAIGLAAGLHAVATLPLNPFTANPVYLENEPIIEFDRNPNPLRDTLLSDHSFTLDEAGSIAVPFNGPGLGIKVDEEALRKYQVPLKTTGVVTRTSAL